MTVLLGMDATDRKYILRYGFPLRCPRCGSDDVVFRFGVYRCRSCGYEDRTVADNPDFFRKQREELLKENLEILSGVEP